MTDRTWWKDKPEFWANKTLGNPTYEQQGKELGAFLTDLSEHVQATNILDVGGYQGRMKQYLPEYLLYNNYDIVNDVDITQPWDEQTGGRIHFDIVFTSLTLLCFPTQEVEKILWEIYGHANKAVVIYEEKWNANLKNGTQINQDYGGKWSYNWLQLMKQKNKAFVHYQISGVNSQWACYMQYVDKRYETHEEIKKI